MTDQLATSETQIPFYPVPLRRFGEYESSVCAYEQYNLFYFPTYSDYSFHII